MKGGDYLTATSEERLARIEEKQDAMREDMAEMKISSKETNTILLAMSDRFLTVDRAEDMRQERNKAIDDLQEDINELEHRTSKLESWRGWLTGAIAVLGFMLGLGAEALRSWKG